MKNASGALRTFLANESEVPTDLFLLCTDLYTFTLVNGLVFRWSSGDRVITFHEGPISSTTLGNGGTGYAVGDTGYLKGVSTDATYLVTGASGGIVTSYTISAAGTRYQVWTDTLTSRSGAQPGSGTGLLINVTAVTGSVTFQVVTPSNLSVPAISRSKISSTVGLSVDDMSIDIISSPFVQVGGVSLQNALQRGDFDGASVFVQRLLSLSPGDTSLGTVTMFAGTVGPLANIGSISCKLTVKAYTELLSINMPRNVYQPTCLNALYDAGCTLSRASFQVSGTVSSGATVISIPTNLTQPGPISPPASAPTLGSTTVASLNLSPEVYYVVVTYVTGLGETVASPETSATVTANRLLTVASPPSATGAIGYNVYVGLSPGSGQRQNGVPISIGTGWTEAKTGLVQGQPPPAVPTGGYFSQGVITFTSGANIGVSRVISSYPSPGQVNILVGLAAAPASGDTFTIVPGCDRQMPTCDKKFSNLINYRGIPFIPTPESVI